MSERAASVTSAWRWIDVSIRAASAARPGTSLGCTTTCPAVPMVRRTASTLRVAASTTASRVADRGVVGVAVSSVGSSGALERGIALEVDESQREFQAADAVGDRVVDLLEQRGAAVGEPVDERELPERSGAVERLLGEHAAEVEERAVVGGCRHGDDAHVRVDVEGGVVGKLGRHDAHRCTDDALAQARDRVEGPVQRVPQPLVARTPIENRQVAEVGPQCRILLDRPHDRFGVRHPHGSHRTAIVVKPVRGPSRENRAVEAFAREVAHCPKRVIPGRGVTRSHSSFPA